MANNIIHHNFRALEWETEETGDEVMKDLAQNTALQYMADARITLSKPQFHQRKFVDYTNREDQLRTIADEIYDLARRITEIVPRQWEDGQ